MAAVGIAWGLYDSLRGSTAAAAGGPAPSLPSGTPGWTVPAAGAAVPAGQSGAATPALVVPPEVARLVRLAVSAAGADGHVADDERALILRQARAAGVESLVDEELETPRPLAEIVAGVTAEAERRDLYVLAFTIVRADESVSGAERIYLAQLAHALGLDVATAAAIEQQTGAAIEGVPGQLPAAP